MLPSSASTASPSSRTGARVVTGYKLVTVFCAMLLTYCIVVGYGLLSGSVAADSAFALIAFACLIPALVGMIGFLLSGPERDWSLLLTCVGWGCASLALLIEHGVLRSARNSAAPGELVVPPDTPIAAIFFAFLAVAFILAGAVLGYQGWTSSQETGG